MDYLYFCSEWIVNIEQINFYEDIFEVAKEVQAEVGFIEQWQPNERGLITHIIFLKASSQERLNMFIEKVGKDLGLIKWTPTSEEEFLKSGKNQSTLEPLTYAGWLDTIAHKTTYNQKTLRGDRKST